MWSILSPEANDKASREDLISLAIAHNQLADTLTVVHNNHSVWRQETSIQNFFDNREVGAELEIDEQDIKRCRQFLQPGWVSTFLQHPGQYIRVFCQSLKYLDTIVVPFRRKSRTCLRRELMVALDRHNLESDQEQLLCVPCDRYLRLGLSSPLMPCNSTQTGITPDVKDCCSP